MSRVLRHLALAAVLAGPEAMAAGLPAGGDPGAVGQERFRDQRRLERGLEPAPSSGPVIDAPILPEDKLPDGGPKFVLKGVAFDPSRFLDPSGLDALVAPHLGREADFTVLKEIIAQVNRRYRAAGIATASAMLPPQKIRDGIVRVALVEGRVGKVEVEGATFTAPEFVTQRVAPAGSDVLDSRALERDILWFNRSNDAQVRASLRPGDEFGLTDVLLTVTEPARDALVVSLDNHGYSSTGREQAGLFARRNGLFLDGDRASFYGIGAEGAQTGSLSYNVPLGPWGTRLGVSFSHTRTQIVSGAFADLDVKGRSDQAALNLAQPLYVHPDWTISALGALAYSAPVTDIGDVRAADGNVLKTSLGGSVTFLQPGFSMTLTPTGSFAKAEDRLLGGTNRFWLYNTTVETNAQLDPRTVLSFNGSMQLASAGNLPGDQVFQIGGPYSNRAYEPGMVSAARGYQMSAEITRQLLSEPLGLDVSAFYDRARVYNTNLPVSELNSIGLGLRVVPVEGLTGELDMAWPLDRGVPREEIPTLYARIVWAAF